MSKPRIGLTTYRQRGQSGVWDTEIAFTPAFYIEAITRAGGLAVLLPPQQLELADAKAILSGLDGLVVSGGRDVDARLYNETPGPHSEAPDELRDQSESMLLKAAIEENFPFLGICRGAQLLNVVRVETSSSTCPTKLAAISTSWEMRCSTPFRSACLRALRSTTSSATG